MNNPNPRALLEKSSLRVQKAFDTTYSRIYRKLSIALDFSHNPMFLAISIYSLYKYLDSEFGSLNAELEDKVSEEIEQAYLLGFAVGLMAYYNSIKVSFTFESVMAEASLGVDKAILIKLKKVAMKDLLQVTKNTDYMTKKLIQDVMTKHLTINHMKNMAREDLANAIIKDLSGKKLKGDIQKNMVAIVDKAGRRWNVDSYVDMVTRTKAQEVYVQGMKNFADKNGGNGDLAVIPYNPLTVDACKEFEGMIISMTGATEGYPTYDELRSTGMIFHPRCRHTPQPYWGESDIPEDIMATHQEVLAKNDKL